MRWHPIELLVAAGLIAACGALFSVSWCINEQQAMNDCQEQHGVHAAWHTVSVAAVAGIDSCIGCIVV
jgi:hypothetical protein